VTRTPAARTSPVAKATRLPATTTSTADTAEAVAAAAEGTDDGPAKASGAAAGEPAATKPKTTPARTTSARTAASKAAAAKAAAAKTESATKAGAARTAATKAAAAKSAAARAAATSARTAAAAAARAAAVAAAGTDDSDPAGSGEASIATGKASTAAAPASKAPAAAVPAADSSAPVHAATAPESTSSAVSEPATVPAVAGTDDPPVAELSQEDPPTVVLSDLTDSASDDDATRILSVTPDPADEESVEVVRAPVADAASAPAARRPFWRLPRLGGRDAAVTPAEAPAAAAASAAVTAADDANAESDAAGIATDTSSPVDLAPATGATPVSLVDAATTPAEKPATTTPRIAPVLRKPLPPRTGATIVSDSAPVEIAVSGLNKRFGQNVAVAGVDLEVRSGSFYGIVGPNGAGKTTTLSMITGLLRPDSGSIHVHGIDVWADPVAAKRTIGVLPDRLRLFDRLTGAQLLYYSGVLRGLESETVRTRSADLAAAFGLEGALNRLVADYSAGMTKKIALACAMIHSPRVLVLDEPFESVDPVSAVNVTEILQRYVAAGGTVILSSHGMDLIQRVCDHVAIIVQGSVLASGTIDEVRGNVSLEERFVDLAGGRKVAEGLEWLHNFSD